MITLRQQVCTALQGACAQVVYGYPRSFAGAALLSWRESGNRRHAQAGGAEYLAELEYTLEIFAPSPEEAAQIHAGADGRMLGLGFRREASAELFEEDTRICHISSRYRALADAQGNVYQ